MSGGLFRKEAVAARHASALGTVSLVQPTRMWALVSLAVLATAAIGIFLVFGNYASRSTVSGQLVPSRGLVTVVAPTAGVVATVDVSEGAHVAAGQRLAVLVIPHATANGSDTQPIFRDRLAQRRAASNLSWQSSIGQFAVQEAQLRAQIVSLRAELEQLRAEVESKRLQSQIARESLQRMRSLQSEQLISVLQVREQEQAALEYEGQVSSLRRQEKASARALDQVMADLRRVPLDREIALAAHQIADAELDQEQLQAESNRANGIVAPVAGIISLQSAHRGQAVKAGEVLVSILPEHGTLEADLLVTGREIPFIGTGDKVFLRYRAFPFQQFGHQVGRVLRVSRSPVEPAAQSTGPNAATEPLYRVKVSLPSQALKVRGRAERLTAGMLVDADIVRERRTLLEWIFAPLHTME